jgi:outer membrane protein assembly factor BamB
MKALSLAFIATLASRCVVEASDVWPQIRGPSAQGFSEATGITKRWSESENITWKTAIPGEGWSSPVVANGAIWITTALADGHSLHALKIDFVTGKILADVEVFTNEVVPVKHDRNSHASPSPVIDGERVYVHFGSMGTACLSSVDGHKLWENRTLKVDFKVGAGGSPTLWQDHLLLTFDGTDQQFAVALDKLTGKEIWHAPRTATVRLQKVKDESRKSFGTPIIFTIDGAEQCLTAAAERLYANDPKTGKELWYVDYTGYSNASIPVSDGKILILPTGFNHSEVWGITVGGAKGDVTGTHVAWKTKFTGLSQSSPLLIDGRVYVVNDSGILLCLESANGKMLWKERIGPDFAASPIYVDGHMYFFDARGKATIIEPGPTMKVIATNQLDDGCMASPAVVGKSLIVRSKKSLYRIEGK